MAWKEVNHRQETRWDVMCCGSGWGNTGTAPIPNVLLHDNTPCPDCGKNRTMTSSTYAAYDRIMICNRCASEDGVEERYSCGAYYSVLCDRCWDASGARRDLDIVGGATEDEIEAADYRDET